MDTACLANTPPHEMLATLVLIFLGLCKIADWLMALAGLAGTKLAERKIAR